MNSPRVFLTSVGVTALLLAAGCNGAPNTKDGVTKGDDYEYVTPLGSNIPVLVRKGQQPTTGSPTATMSGEEAANAIHGGGNQVMPVKGSP